MKEGRGGARGGTKEGRVGARGGTKEGRVGERGGKKEARAVGTWLHFAEFHLLRIGNCSWVAKLFTPGDAAVLPYGFCPLCIIYRKFSVVCIYFASLMIARESDQKINRRGYYRDTSYVSYDCRIFCYDYSLWL